MAFRISLQAAKTLEQTEKNNRFEHEIYKYQRRLLYVDGTKTKTS